MVPKGDQRRVLTSEEARMLTAPAAQIIDVQAEGSECAPAKEEIEQDSNERQPGDRD